MKTDIVLLLLPTKKKKLKLRWRLDRYWKKNHIGIMLVGDRCLSLCLPPHHHPLQNKTSRNGRTVQYNILGTYVISIDLHRVRYFGRFIKFFFFWTPSQIFTELTDCCFSQAKPYGCRWQWTTPVTTSASTSSDDTTADTKRWAGKTTDRSDEDDNVIYYIYVFIYIYICI